MKNGWDKSSIRYKWGKEEEKGGGSSLFDIRYYNRITVYIIISMVQLYIL